MAILFGKDKKGSSVLITLKIRFFSFPDLRI